MSIKRALLAVPIALFLPLLSNPAHAQYYEFVPLPVPYAGQPDPMDLYYQTYIYPALISGWDSKEVATPHNRLGDSALRCAQFGQSAFGDNALTRAQFGQSAFGDNALTRAQFGQSAFGDNALTRAGRSSQQATQPGC